MAARSSPWLLSWEQTRSRGYVSAYQPDVRSGLPQGSQGSASYVLERLVARQAAQRGELQDEGSHAGGAGDGRLGGTDAAQQVDGAVRHPGGSLERCHPSQHMLHDVTATVHIQTRPRLLTEASEQPLRTKKVPG